MSAFHPKDSPEAWPHQLGGTSAFGLLLGFSPVEVLGGFAKAVEAKVRPAAGDAEPVRIGLLTPLLAIFVMLDLVSFWGAAWSTRETISMSGGVLLGGLLFAGSYYFAAHLVFPPDIRVERELDDHYLRVRRFVLGVVLALFTCQVLYWSSVRPEFLTRPLNLGWTVLFVGLLATAMIVRNRLAGIAVLSLMIAQHVVQFLMS